MNPDNKSRSTFRVSATSRFVLAIVGAVCLLGASAATVESAIVIRDDRGGEVAEYMRRFGSLRDTGEEVAIDGDCFSACTLVIALIPAERICVTPRAKLGFHSIQSPGLSGKGLEQQALSAALIELYPERVQDWLRRNGGLQKRMLVLEAAELRKLYAACAPQTGH